MYLRPGLFGPAKVYHTVYTSFLFLLFSLLIIDHCQTHRRRRISNLDMRPALSVSTTRGVLSEVSNTSRYLLRYWVCRQLDCPN